MTTKIALPTCTLILLLAVSAVAQSGVQSANPSEPAQWLRYTVKGEEFSVMLPTLPSMVTDKVLVRPGSNKRRLERTLMTTADGVLYAIYAYENPKPRRSLANFIMENAVSSRPELFAERRIEINGFVGSEYTSLDKNKRRIEVFFATEKHFYRFFVKGVTQDHPGVERFFSSILLGNKPSGIEVSDGLGNLTEPATDERIYTGKEIDKKVRLLSKPEPQYTEKARKHEVTGTVILKAVFSSTGMVTDIRVISGLPDGLTERCLAAARMVDFIPAMKDGRPVSMWMQLEYNFNLY